MLQKASRKQSLSSGSGRSCPGRTFRTHPLKARNLKKLDSNSRVVSRACLLRVFFHLHPATCNHGHVTLKWPTSFVTPKNLWQPGPFFTMRADGGACCISPGMHLHAHSCAGCLQTSALTGHRRTGLEAVKHRTSSQTRSRSVWLKSHRRSISLTLKIVSKMSYRTNWLSIPRCCVQYDMSGLVIDNHQLCSSHHLC